MYELRTIDGNKCYRLEASKKEKKRSFRGGKSILKVKFTLYTYRIPLSAPLIKQSGAHNAHTSTHIDIKGRILLYRYSLFIVTIILFQILCVHTRIKKQKKGNVKMWKSVAKGTEHNNSRWKKEKERMVEIVLAFTTQ